MSDLTSMVLRVCGYDLEAVGILLENLGAQPQEGSSIERTQCLHCLRLRHKRRGETGFSDARMSALTVEERGGPTKPMSDINSGRGCLENRQ